MSWLTFSGRHPVAIGYVERARAPMGCNPNVPSWPCMSLRRRARRSAILDSATGTCSRCRRMFAWFLRALARSGSYTCLNIDMSLPNRQRLYFLFFLSGFCSLVYQMVWTRLAFASFGIITPVLSVVISVFMLGLSIGAWAGGRVIPSLVRRTGVSAIFFYGGAELIIGLGAFATPKLFALGQHCLLAAGQTDSFRYLF